MSKETGYTTRQAAERLGVSLHHVYELIWTGKLQALRVDGRWVVLPQVIKARLRQKGKKDGRPTGR